MHSSLEQEPLSFGRAAIAAACLLVIVSVAVSIFALLNQTRGTQVIAQYDEVVERFVGTNQGGVEDLFTLIMNACKAQHEKKPVAPNVIRELECQEARTHLNLLDKSALPNYSSVVFVRASNGNVEAIEASGQYHAPAPLMSNYFFNSWREDNVKNLQHYLMEGKDIYRWQDFIGQLPKKEVVTPVKKNGAIVGYIFQSVLEL